MSLTLVEPEAHDKAGREAKALPMPGHGAAESHTQTHALICRSGPRANAVLEPKVSKGRKRQGGPDSQPYLLTMGP